MRNGAAIRALLAMSLMDHQSSLPVLNSLPSRINNSNLVSFPSKKFYEQSSVKFIIKDWHQIILGQSKKAKIKKARVIKTVNTWVEKEYITEEQIATILNS